MAIHPLPLILASASTSRHLLLAQTQFKFTHQQSQFDEASVTDRSPQQRVIKLAQAKANAVQLRLDYPALILAADTLLIFNRRVLGKPKFKMDAVEMLKMLSGNIHTVVTGWALLNTYKNSWHTGLSETYVTFRHLTDKEIINYVNDNPVTQWSGGYNSSLSSAMSFITHVKGSLTGLNGLPLDQIVPIIQHEYAHPYKKKTIQSRKDSK